MGFIKYLFLAIVSVCIFILAVFDVDAGDLLSKSGMILAIAVVLVVMNFFIKIAWKLLMMIILTAIILFALSYFGVLEFSSNGFVDFFKNLF